MQKIVKYFLILCLGNTLFPSLLYAASAMLPRQALYNYARTGNVSAIQHLRSTGYSIDTPDQYGNSALCEAVLKKDYSTFSVLKQMGASMTHPCVQRMSPQAIQQFNQGYTTWAKAVNARQISYVGASHSIGSGASTIVATSSGISAATVVGITAGAAALIGGGIALASGGGGGGGGSSNFQATDPCAGITCSTGYFCQNGACVKATDDPSSTPGQPQNCEHGSVSGNTCVCAEGWIGDTCSTAAYCIGYNITNKQCPPNATSCSSCKRGYRTVLKVDACRDGWTGTSCDTPVTCPYTTTSCSAGYVSTGKFCQSGTNVYIECVPVDCASQGYSLNCEEGYNATPACLSRETQYYSCTPKEVPEGYSTIPCSGGYYQEGETLISGITPYFKCIANDCSGYETSCGEGYDASADCLSGTTQYYTCTQKEVPAGYSPTPCSAGYYQEGATFISGTTPYYKCTPNDCSGYETSCGEGYNSSADCLSGETQYYTCTPKDVPAGYTSTPCSEGYYQEGEPFISGNTPYYKCIANDCSAYETSCGDKYAATPACLSGTIQYYSCNLVTLNCVHGIQTHITCSCEEGWSGTLCDTPATCPYTSEGCSTGYHETGSTCKSGDAIYHECIQNTTSYCVAQGFPLSNCPTHASVCNVCKAGNYNRYRVDACKPGWEGEKCSTPTTCPYTTTICGVKNHASGNTCQSGNNLYQECIDNTLEYCTSNGFTLTSCPATSCAPCVAGNTIRWKVTGTCNDGWEGEDCQTPSTCGSEYNKTNCPQHANCTPCTSGNKTKYRIDSCKAGYEGDNCNDEIYCPYKTLSCGAGFHETGLTCQSGETIYQICAEDDIDDCEANGFTLDACPYWAEICSACTSSNGVKFKATLCWEGWDGPTCETEYNCGDDYVPSSGTCTGEYSKKTNNICWSGENALYECTCPGFTSDENCVSPEQICEKNGTSFYKCAQCKAGWISSGNSTCFVNGCSGYNLASCPDNAAQCEQCLSDTTTKWRVVTCNNGWKGSDCTTPQSCDGYDFDACPENALECETCLSGTTTKYRIALCPPGHTLVENACVCSDKGSLMEIPHCQTETTCQSGGMTYHTCTACDDGYNLWNNTCVICPANYYAEGGTCHDCPANSSSPANSTGADACVCNEGYEKANGLCRLIVPEADKPKWRPATREDFETNPNYIGSNYLAAINAAQAYSKFILYNEQDGKFDYSTLAPVKVIVHDTKGEDIYETWGDLINFAKDDQGNYDSLSEDNVSNGGTHGLHIASAIAAKWNNEDAVTQHYAGIGNHSSNPYQYRFWGVAPNASVYSISRSAPDQIKLLTTAIERGARVINMSYQSVVPMSYTAEELSESFANTVNYFQNYYSEFFRLMGRNNVVMVQGAGNDGGKQPGWMAAAGGYEWYEDGQKYSLKNLYIAATGGIYSSTAADGPGHWSRCGQAQAWCIWAPDAPRTVWTAMYNDTPDTSTRGTSYSTAVTTGAVAFLMGAYPYMTSQQIVELIFRSANRNLRDWTSDGYWTDSFGNVYRTSSIYGHGMLDLGQATEPMGVLSIPTSAGSTSTMGDLNAINKVSITSTQLALPRILNSNLSVSLPSTIMGLDDYNRPFPIQTQGFIKQAHRTDQSFKRHFKSFMYRDRRTITGVPDKMTFEFKPSITDQNLLGMGVLDINYHYHDKASLLFSYRSNRLDEEKHFEKALANPFLDMRNSYSLTQSFTPNKRWTFKFGATVGKNDFYEGDEDLDEEYNKSMKAFSSEVDYKLKGNVTLKFLGGLLSEKDSVLGMNGTGALETDNSKTYFAGTGITYNPVSRLSLSAVYYYGQTEMPKSKGLVSFDKIISDAFALDARYDLDDNRTGGIQFASPLRIKKGSAIFNIPVGRDLYSDTVYYDPMKLRLKPSAREYDISLYYTQEARYYDWRGELMTRIHPDHMSDAKPDYRALFGVSLKY